MSLFITLHKSIWVLNEFQAVKKSRIKQKEHAMDTERRVEKLKAEKVTLERRIQEKEKEKTLLKDLFLEAAQLKSKSNPNLNLQEILKDCDDDKNVVNA